MEAEYKREANRNYMVLRPEPGRMDRYTIRMLSGNQIAGLLPFQEKWVNGENHYYYDITSKQPLSRLLEYRTMNGEEMHSFVSGFLHAVQQMERFLLDENQVCLEPEYVYVEPETFCCTLLVVPGRYWDFTREFRALCQYLLDHVNQNDGDAVILGFSIFKESQKENFGLRDVERCLERTEKKECTETPVSMVMEDAENDRLKYEDFFDTEKIEREEVEEEKPKWKMVLAGIFLAIAVFVPVGTGIVGGIDSLFRLKFYLLGLEVLLFLVFLLVGAKKKPMEEDGKAAFKSEPEYLETAPAYDEIVPAKSAEILLQEDNLQTVLLTAKPVGGASRYLVPVGGGEEIPIRYFPFLIGKNKGIVDLYLNETGISRLHAKLEERDGQYYVTDLNSTNGVMVDGVWLKTNETRQLPVGSELILAASRFYFR